MSRKMCVPMVIKCWSRGIVSSHNCWSERINDQQRETQSGRSRTAAARVASQPVEKMPKWELSKTNGISPRWYGKRLRQSHRTGEWRRAHDKAQDLDTCVRVQVCLETANIEPSAGLFYTEVSDFQSIYFWPIGQFLNLPPRFFPSLVYI